MYTISITSIKPENSQWQKDADPEAYLGYMKWMSTIPGLLYEETIRPEPNVIIKTITFIDEAAYLAAKEAHSTEPIAIQRNQYNDENGIVSEVHEIG
jgi:hypothetical protein